MHTHRRVISFPRMVIFSRRCPQINQIATPRHRHLRITEKSPTNYLVNRIILVTCGCKPFSSDLAHNRRPKTRNIATMKRRLSILLILLAATVISALAHSSPVLGNVRSVVREDGAVVESNEYYPYGGLFSSTPSVQPYKYGAQPLARRSGRCNVGRMPVATTKTTFGNELDRTHGLDWYDFQARFYDSILLRTNSVDKKAGDYTWLSPYSWCAGNPIRFTDPTGKFLLENFDNDDFVYCTVAIFPTNRDNVLQKDYDAAYNAGVPIICVDNVEDLKSGLEMLNNLNISSETFTINSHGESGSFSIGDDRIFCTSDLSSLNTYFSGKTVFIGACNVGVGQLGALITKNLSSMFDASVITSQHLVSAGYDYRGGSSLSKSSYLDNNKFLISSSGGNAIKISDVAVHKNYGIKWNVVGTRNWSIYSNSKTRNKW